MRLRFLPAGAVLSAAFTLICNLQAQPLVNIETVTVGDSGNAADVSGFGSVSYEFNIGKYEVTIGQYTTFLNAVAASDPYGLYSTEMFDNSSIRGIARNGSAGSFTYAATSVSGGGSPNRPIAFISWFDAARFANWMHNGATTNASTETGAYSLNGATSGIITKNVGATWWIPTEDEWYKAAFYKGGGTNTGYWLFPTQSDLAPTAEATPPGSSNSANYAGVRPPLLKLTDVGAYSNSASSYGTFDQGGNLSEWNDTVWSVHPALRQFRGGNWNSTSNPLASILGGGSAVSPDWQNQYQGFRLATVPEPSAYALLLMTGAGALWWMRRRR